MKMKITKGSNKYLSRNFNSNEFDCKCTRESCTTTIINTDQIVKLQQLRRILKKPIKINSGFRCEEHNESVGGSPTSQHVAGNATDIAVSGMSTSELIKIIKGMKNTFKGIGLYDSFIHVDSRENVARWDYRKSTK